ncbi:unnamed protein product [Spirodela intermedia]|uniref:EGF-like domain-containing protein n=1 Tax=Spirodela intermedia TaxID=51605 RepID=A0A7I8J0V4_SPIIN|nr:unnamed protein product [Spirodela intermedia]CAA6663041.1 unnamed protein product [Spirodela intermedia]
MSGVGVGGGGGGFGGNLPQWVLRQGDTGHSEIPVFLHSCIHDEILQKRRNPGRKEYSVSPQVYSRSDLLKDFEKNSRQPIRIFLNYDSLGHSQDRDCRDAGDIVKSLNFNSWIPACNPLADRPIFGDCWYNCSSDDISMAEKKLRLQRALERTADWFKRTLSVEPVKGNLRLSGYSACGQDGGLQLPREYVEDGVSDADLVLLVTTRPTTGNTLAWAVTCERDQWGRAIAGHVNVAPRHLTAEAETLLSATLIHELFLSAGHACSWFDPHAIAHFRDERKRRRNQVTVQAMDEKLGRMVTRIVLPRVVMHSRLHYGETIDSVSLWEAFSANFTGLELEDGGKRLLMNEIMTAQWTLDQCGWYKVNYSMVDRLDCGRKQGIEFVTSPCNQWKGAYHCNTTNWGYCPIVSYTRDLPQWTQYLPQANKGGQSSLADYCAYFVAYSDGSCTDVNPARAPDMMLGEVRGSSSRCMASSLVRSGFARGSMTQGNGCYQHRCARNVLEVAMDGIWKACPEAGAQSNSLVSTLICPAYHELCDTLPVTPPRGHCPNSCGFNVDCLEGSCRCFLGFYGHDCSQRACPGNCSGHGVCRPDGICECVHGRTGVDCSTAVQPAWWVKFCNDGVCEFRCSDYAGYSCQTGSSLLSSLSACQELLMGDAAGQYCAPSGGRRAKLWPLLLVGRSLFDFLELSYCAAAARQLTCWISIQRCDMDGDNRLRVCRSVSGDYNAACGASLDSARCTGYGEAPRGWLRSIRRIYAQ